MLTNSRLFSFIGGDQGPWKATESRCITGEALPGIDRLEIISGLSPQLDATWILQGAMSNERYVTHSEKAKLVEKQEGLGRPEASCAVLIPIKKSPAWWAMSQDERRAVFEAQSHHNQIGMEYLPAIARRLHHCRDLTEEQPFDFLTWFEFAPAAEASFDQLLARLRASVEWGYVEREVEIRLLRD